MNIAEPNILHEEILISTKKIVTDTGNEFPTKWKGPKHAKVDVEETRFDYYPVFGRVAGWARKE